MKKNPTFLKKFISVLKNVVLMAVVVYAVTAFQQRNLLSTDKTPAPYFNLATLKNPTERMTIAQLQGKQTVVYFFAPWCSICRYSMPNLEKAHQQGKLNAIAIALDYQNIAEVKQFTDSLELTMPVLLGSKSTGQDYKISAYQLIMLLMSSWPLLRILWVTQQNLALGCAHLISSIAFSEKKQNSAIDFMRCFYSFNPLR